MHYAGCYYLYDPGYWQSDECRL
ncbi:hypothetical protein [Paenibacillus alvei]